MYVPSTLVRVRRLYVYVKANCDEGRNMVRHFGKALSENDGSGYWDCILVPIVDDTPERRVEIGREISEFCHGHVTVTVYLSKEDALEPVIAERIRFAQVNGEVASRIRSQNEMALSMFPDSPFGLWKDGQWVQKWRWKCVSDLNCSVYV